MNLRLHDENPWDFDVPRDHPAVEAAVFHYVEWGWLPVDLATELLEAGIYVEQLIQAIDNLQENLGFELYDLGEILLDGEDDDDGDPWLH